MFTRFPKFKTLQLNPQSIHNHNPIKTPSILHHNSPKNSILSIYTILKLEFKLHLSSLINNPRTTTPKTSQNQLISTFTTRKPLMNHNNKTKPNYSNKLGFGGVIPSLESGKSSE